jgi:hypothetical protein
MRDVVLVKCNVRVYGLIPFYYVSRGRRVTEGRQKSKLKQEENTLNNVVVTSNAYRNVLSPRVNGPSSKINYCLSLFESQSIATFHARAYFILSQRLKVHKNGLTVHW